MDQLVNFIIRPPRAEYDPEHDLLEKKFMMKGRWYQRKDLEVNALSLLNSSVSTIVINGGCNNRGPTVFCSCKVDVFIEVR
jgi:hypothetical protein